MAPNERIRNAVIGLSVIWWGISVLLNAPEGAPVTVVRTTIAVVDFTVGLLILLRAPVRRGLTARAVLISVPSILVTGVALKLSPRADLWPVTAQVVFLCGAALALLSFFYLGKSFSVLPALRGIVSRGPYRWVRHPAYVGELIMVAACVAAGPTPYSSSTLAAALPLVILRILAEEAVLGRDRSYGAYCRSVPYRLVPGLW